MCVCTMCAWCHGNQKTTSGLRGLGATDCELPCSRCSEFELGLCVRAGSIVNCWAQLVELLIVILMIFARWLDYGLAIPFQEIWLTHRAISLAWIFSFYCLVPVVFWWPLGVARDSRFTLYIPTPYMELSVSPNKPWILFPWNSTSRPQFALLLDCFCDYCF